MAAEFDYAGKVRKLLDKAESTTFADERDSLIAKAQHLMTTYAIDEAMLDARKQKGREQIVKEGIVYTGIFQAVTMGMGSAVARVNGCEAYYSKRDYEKPKKHIMNIVGFESDVRRTLLLETSLSVQCAAALQTFVKEGGLPSWMSKMEKYKARRTFIASFIHGVGDKLRAAEREATKETVERRAAAENSDVKTVTDEVGIVLRDRKDQVTDWMDTNVGQLSHSRQRYQSGGLSAAVAGRAAGAMADTGTSNIGGGAGRKALGG